MRWMGTAASLVVLWTCGCVVPPAWSADGWSTQIYGTHVLRATLDTSDVQESSGVLVSRNQPNILWTHNDSGSLGPRAWAVQMPTTGSSTAHTLGYVQLSGAGNGDWEDMSAGPGGRIYMFDGGDNPPCNRTDKRIHRFVEPVIDPASAPIAMNVAFESIRFEYPDTSNPTAPADSDAERYDAECLMVHPVTGDIYIVTKRDTSDIGIARLYRLAAANIQWNGAQVHVLEYMADLTAVLGVSGPVASTVTAGDIDPAGQRVLIRRYGFACEFTAPADEPFETAFAQTPVSLGLSGEVQGEGISYAADGSDIYTTSEVVFVGGIPIGPSTCPIYVTPWLMANAGVRTLRMQRAVIGWDTAEAEASAVDYGATTTYGATIENATPVTEHLVELADLTSNTTYYCRVRSGSLSYPPVASAGDTFFTTLAHMRADFDGDDDVDVEDFAHLQVCLSGPSAPQLLPACSDARLDDDVDVDGSDFVLWLACLSGPNLPIDPACDL